MNCKIIKQRGMSYRQLWSEKKHNQNKRYILEQKA